MLNTCWSINWKRCKCEIIFVASVVLRQSFQARYKWVFLLAYVNKNKSKADWQMNGIQYAPNLWKIMIKCLVTEQNHGRGENTAGSVSQPRSNHAFIGDSGRILPETLFSTSARHDLTGSLVREWASSSWHTSHWTIVDLSLSDSTEERACISMGHSVWIWNLWQIMTNWNIH